MNFFFLCVLLFSFIEVDAAVIKIETRKEYEILEHFFRIGVSEEGYSYVLDGEKPISVRNYYSLDDFPVAKDLEYSEREFASTLLIREVIPIWNKCCTPQSKFFLKSVPLNKSGEPELGWEVQFINLPKLQDTIEKNINLFRYVLGPCVDSIQLSNKIARSEESLIDILNNDSVLIGIVLGFGSHNSLLGGRKDQISNLGLSRDLFPFSPKSLSLQHKECYFAYYLEEAAGEKALNEFPNDALKPSIGITNLEEEIKFINNLNDPLPRCLNENEPVFIFGAYKKGPTNRHLFKRLVRSQKEAQSLLQKKDFLESVLKKISGEKPTIACDRAVSKDLSLDFFKDKLPLDTWVHILNKTAQRFKEKERQVAFLDAFAHPTFPPIPPSMVGVTEGTWKGLTLALQNLSKTNGYFENISKDTSLKPLVSNQLYYKTLTEGSGKELKGAGRVRLSYLVEDTEGNILLANDDLWITLSQAIQGLAYGLQGMHIGEKRQIIVHPCLGYGAHTTLHPCSALNIKVELLDIDKKSCAPLPALNPLDLEWIADPALHNYVEKSLQLLPSFLGSFLRSLVDKIEGPDKAMTILNLLRKNECSK